jgi:poly(ADP-ribose) glycohydrolase ARH3
MTDVKSKYLGCMVGSALGDAIGELAFFHSKKEDLLAALKRLDELRYTDDTAMAIGLAESIVRKGRLEQGDLGETFRKNFGTEPWRGYASGPPTVFSMVEELGIAFTDAAQMLFGGRGSFGNGAAMRVAPVGLFFHNSPDLYEMARASAAVTHAHPIGIDGAAVQAKAVARAVELDSSESFSQEIFIASLYDFAKTVEMKDKILEVQKLLATDASPPVAARQLGSTVAVHESLPFALFSFLRYPNSFEECLSCATLNGGDRDTLGAMACAISGAYLGVQSIPQAWRDNLENRSYIEDLALRTYECCRGS